MVQRTYYPPPERPALLPPAPAPSVEPEFTSLRAMHIRHGYTLDDLDRMTKMALGADRLLAMDTVERHDIAWSAIAEALCAAQEPPHYQELVRVGWQAIYRHVRDGLRQRGYADGARDWSSYNPTMPRFAQYWANRTEPSHEDRVVEKIATDQVLAAVGGPYRDAVVALAVHEDYVRAAAALGVRDGTLRQRLTVAREQFLCHWHEGETPPARRRRDGRVASRIAEPATSCSKGHEWTPENTQIRQSMVRGRPKRQRVCRACERDRGSARRADRKAAVA